MTTVTTKSGAKYLIDEDAHTIQRIADHEIKWLGPGKAAPLTVSAPREYVWIRDYQVGSRIDVDLADGTFMISTEIVSIES